MTEVLLFHHAQGQTPGFLAFADRWRGAGHIVHTPDLFEDGSTYASVDEGVAHAQAIGFEEIIRRGTVAAQYLPERIAYAGFSLGVMPAQSLAQTRHGALGALLLHSAVPPDSFGGPWPPGLPLQMQSTEADAWGDVPIMAELARDVPGAELFLYPGSGHLFADPGSVDYDEEAAALLVQRTLDFLDRIG